jgi:plastocyanin
MRHWLLVSPFLTTIVWTEFLSDSMSDCPAIIVPPTACIIATSGVRNRTFLTFPISRLPLTNVSRLANTAYQPNPINIKVGDTIEWANKDSSPHTVTKKDRSISNNDESDNDSSSGFVERIVDEIITNRVVNIRNNLPGSEDNISSQEDSSLSSSAEFDSGIMRTGDTFSYTFNNPGTFEYYCAAHPSMVGEIVVS